MWWWVISPGFQKQWVIGNEWLSAKLILCFSFFFIANNAWLFSVILCTFPLSSRRWDKKKKGDLLARRPHAMVRRLNSLKGIYPLLLWLILCGLPVSERSPIASTSYKRDSWCSNSFPCPGPKMHYSSKRWMTRCCRHATPDHLQKSDLKAFSLLSWTQTCHFV